MPNIQPRIVLRSIDLRRDGYGEHEKLVGSARFGSLSSSYRDNTVEITIQLSAAQMQAIITACGDSLKENAQKQAAAFYESAAELTSKLLENGKDEVPPA